MKLVTFNTTDNLEKRIGIIDITENLIIPFSELNLEKKYLDMNMLIEEISDSDLKLLKNLSLEKNNNFLKSYDIKNVTFFSPIEKPKHDIICVGLNYLDHISETKSDFSKTSPDCITFFGKRAICMTAHNSDIESHNDLDISLDYEVELAIIIGKKGRDIKEEEAIDYIFGFSILNDISARTLQKNHSQWFKGKSLDSFSAMGPCIVHKDSFKFPLNLNISSYINGEIRQNSNTSFMISNVSKIISEFSKGITLEPGDIIATGTPSGVGMGFSPPKYLKKGDIIECHIENIGTLSNKII